MSEQQDVVIELPVEVQQPEPVKRGPGRPKGSKSLSHARGTSGQKTEVVSRDRATRVEKRADFEGKFDESTVDFGSKKPNDVATEPFSISQTGDCFVRLAVRENYVEALAQEATLQGLSLGELVQQRLDWWLENEFSFMPARG